MLRLISILAVLTPASTMAQTVEYEHARAALAIAHALTTQSDADSDVCPACNGAGKVGDGVIMTKCEECDGTGKRSTSDVSVLEPAVQEAAQQLADETGRICLNPDCPCPFGECTCRPCTCGEVARPPDAPIEVEWSVEQADQESGTLSGPRAYFLTAPYCGLCKQMVSEAEHLYGPDSLIQLVDIQERPNYASELGVRTTRSIPVVIAVDENGAEVARIKGFHRPSTVESFVRGHGVEVPSAAATDGPMVVATVHGPPSASSAVLALAEHLARQKAPEDVPVGGLFDKDVEVPDTVPRLLSVVMSGEALDIAAGVTVQWTGDDRSILFASAETVNLSPPVDIRLKKWGLSVSTTLDAVTVSEQGRTVRFNLKGPDFTVRFVDE